VDPVAAFYGLVAALWIVALAGTYLLVRFVAALIEHRHAPTLTQAEIERIHRYTDSLC
jgi:hypothetical protein